MSLSIALPACLDEADDLELSETESEATVTQWPNDTQIPDKFSARAVALAPFNNRLYMAYTDHSTISSTEILFAWWNGVSWSTSLTTGRYSKTRPALTEYNDRLTMIYQPAGTTGLHMMSTSNLTWTAPVPAGRSLAIGGYTASSPSATVIGGNLYVTYCANNGSSSYVNVDKYDGTSWTAFRQIQVSTTPANFCDSALLATMPEGGVEIIYNIEGSAAGAMRRVRGSIGRSTTVWYPSERLPMDSANALSVVTCDGVTHLVHGGHTFPNQLWWAYRKNGDWSTDVQIQNQWSTAGAALGCLNGSSTLMVHNSSGGTNALMQSLWAP